MPSLVIKNITNKTPEFIRSVISSMNYGTINKIVINSQENPFSNELENHAIVHFKTWNLRLTEITRFMLYNGKELTIFYDEKEDTDYWKVGAYDPPVVPMPIDTFQIIPPLLKLNDIDRNIDYDNIVANEFTDDEEVREPTETSSLSSSIGETSSIHNIFMEYETTNTDNDTTAESVTDTSSISYIDEIYGYSPILPINLLDDFNETVFSPTNVAADENVSSNSENTSIEDIDEMSYLYLPSSVVNENNETVFIDIYDEEMDGLMGIHFPETDNNLYVSSSDDDENNEDDEIVNYMDETTRIDGYVTEYNLLTPPANSYPLSIPRNVIHYLNLPPVVPTTPFSRYYRTMLQKYSA